VIFALLIRTAAVIDRRDHAMKRFVNERDIPGADKLTAELAEIGALTAQPGDG
jgi:hypothetical protein